MVSNPRTVRLAALASVLLALVAGCAQKPRPRVVRPVKPWLRAQSLCIFPMSRSIAPETPQSLASSLERGWVERLDVPAGADLVRIDGTDDYPRLASMTIDLTGAAVPGRRKAKKLKPVGRPGGSLRVDHFELVADPLRVEKANLQVRLLASDARLELRRDKCGHPMLTLSGAEAGRVLMAVSRKDIDSLLLHSARQAAGKYGVAVDSTRLRLSVVDHRSLRVDLKVRVRVGALLPAGLRVRARMDVDDQLNGRITRLTCDGDELLGPLISAFVRPALDKYEGKKRPLVGFVFGNMRLRDLKVDVRDGFQLEAQFGNVPETTASPGAAPHRTFSPCAVPSP